MKRRQTKQIKVGKVGVGSDYPITVQSMTTTKTKDTEKTLEQVYELASNGADIVRVTCNEVDAATSLIKISTRSPVPIIADIHFQYKLALAAIEAGVQGLRLNPGNIRDEKHIKEVGILFDLYRQFYKYESNLMESTNYIKDRINNNESTIFIATSDADEAIGFVQLYETFGSLDLGKIIILYDLYVKEDHRKNNIGRQLMIRSHEYAKKINAKRIQLSTATDNFIGQSLYESLGYIKDKDFYTYDFEI